MKRSLLKHGLIALMLLIGTVVVNAQTMPGFPFPDEDQHEGGVLEPTSSHTEGHVVRIPNTDQSVDGFEQSNILGGRAGIEIEDAFAGGVTSLTGHEITHIASPNDDMRDALAGILGAAQGGDMDGVHAWAADLKDILFGKTQGRIYDGYSMLNYNRFKNMDRSGVGMEHIAPGLDHGEYKMRTVTDTGETFISPFDGETRRIWETSIHYLYYDGQIDSDMFLINFPSEAHADDTVRLHVTIYSVVSEDFSPTVVMLDRRMTPTTVNFPFKGMDHVWVAFEPGQKVEMTLKLPPVRMLRGIYNWGWRVHPPRIQFLQPTYRITDRRESSPTFGQDVWDPESESFVYRNREELTLDAIATAAPEYKMLQLVEAIEGGLSVSQVVQWMTSENRGPRGTWIQWADLAKEQRQLPPEALDMLAAEGLAPGEFGDYEFVTVMMNNEAYGRGPRLNEVVTWKQGDAFQVKIINFDRHTHYFRNVDFGTRLHDDILRCCGGGQTSFEVMNFKPSYGAPKVAEMQWRAGWGFRPHYDVILQQGVFPRASDRTKVIPYTGGNGDTHFGYQYSAANRQGDFRFNPPPFIITDITHPAEFPLRDASDGKPGLLLGQKTEGYGHGYFCSEDPFPGFCTKDIQDYNPNGVVNFPPPPLRGAPVFPSDLGKFPGDVYPDHAVELRFPPFLRNPCQNDEQHCGDIIPPTDVWRPFIWLSPHNGTIWIDPEDHSKGFWADLSYAHGRPVFGANDPRAESDPYFKNVVSANVELPRAAGQVFYQFDDLFHDNMIFSPHPLSEGGNTADKVRGRALGPNANGRVFTAVRGRLLPNGDGEAISGWVTIFQGQAGDHGCEGTVLGSQKVDDKGRYVFRCTSNNGCNPPKKLGNGDTLCVQSTMGGVAEMTIQ